jgi:hypothetical protein
MSTSDTPDLTIESQVQESFSDEAAQAALDLLPEDCDYQRYGGNTLRQGDRDANSSTSSLETERVIEPASEDSQLFPGLCMDPTEVQPPTISFLGYVRRLQFDLRALGFKMIRDPDGVFGPHTEQAVREFQIYASMGRVAQENPEAEGEYVERLSSVEHDLSSNTHYPGQITGVANEQTRSCLVHWLIHGYRCPVVVTARTGDGYGSVYDGDEVPDGADPENLWSHDDVQTTDCRMFVHDFTDHFLDPEEVNQNSSFLDPGSGLRNTEDAISYERGSRITLGYFDEGGTYSGPAAEEKHTWDAAEVRPDLFELNGDTWNTDTAKTFRVIRAVAEIECNGSLDMLNAWDTAVLSAGPFHWTLAVFLGEVVAEGELGAFLAYLKSEYEGAYKQVFGKDAFGVRPSGEWDGNGEALFDSAQRTYTTLLDQVSQSGVETIPTGTGEVSFEDAEPEWLYFRNWHWYYRFAMASRVSEGFQQACWDFARLRLPAILWGDWPEAPSGSDWSNLNWTGDATVGDVFTSEKAVAMLLRWHVYRPAHMSAGARSDTRRLEDIFEIARTEEGPRLDWEQDPTNWEDEHEKALIESIERQADADGIAGDSKLDSLRDDLKQSRADSFRVDLESIDFGLDYLR